MTGAHPAESTGASRDDEGADNPEAVGHLIEQHAGCATR